MSLGGLRCLPNELVRLVGQYALSPPVKFLDWIDPKIRWSYLSENPAAIPLLEKHLEKIRWSYLSRNPSAIPLLEKHPEKINWACLDRKRAV